MSDSTSRTPGNEAPAVAAIRAANASLLGKKHPSKQFERDAYATATNAGYGTAMGRGLELAITLLVMVGIGFGLDHLFGTAPVFAIVFAVLGFAGTTVKLFLGYDREMKKHEDGAIWNRTSEAS